MAAGALDDMLSRVPVDEIGARARQIRLGHILLTVLGAVLIGVSWCAAKVLLLAWFVLWGWARWVIAALMVGWEAAAKSTKLEPKPSRESLTAEVARLRQEIARLS
jgi:hypothetical protein